MQGKLTLSVLQESHEGPIGDDWRYWVEAKVFNDGLKGKGRVTVGKHRLPSGTTQVPPGPPPPVEIAAGECGGEVKIVLKLEATEVDVFRNDVGKASFDLYLPCPGPGEEPLLQERDFSVGVIESPGLTGASSVITLKVRLVLSCS